MSIWVNRTVLSGSSVDENGTASHTCTFTAASSGNFLVAVVAGAVTFTTPAGWTLAVSAVNNTGLYVFTKTASASEASFSTTHNGSNYAILGVVYEFAAGSAIIGSNSVVSQGLTASTPTVSGLTGTYHQFAARSWGLAAGSSTASTSWSLPGTEDYDAYVPSGSNDGDHLTIAYDQDSSGSSFSPSSTSSNYLATSSGEGVAWALTVPTTSNMASYIWLGGINSP